MAREIAISRAFRKALQTRFRNTIYGDLKGLLDTILPVQILGTDYSDQERPAWCITGSQGALVGQYSTASLTSAVDVALESISWRSLDPGTGSAFAQLHILTPPDTWVPFLFNGVIWTAGVRPRTEFDSGQTVIVTGTNPAPPPYTGFILRPSRTLAGGILMTGPTDYNFLPPLILPATLYLTFVPSIPADDLIVSVRYREVG